MPLEIPETSKLIEHTKNFLKHTHTHTHTHTHHTKNVYVSPDEAPLRIGGGDELIAVGKVVPEVVVVMSVSICHVQASNESTYNLPSLLPCTHAAVQSVN